MDALLNFLPFALEGQWKGAAAVALVTVGVLIFIGAIYVLLVAVYGWLQAYLVTMVALMAFSIILAAVWLVGIPGTIPGTGPRGTEPTWVPFLVDSEQGTVFSSNLSAFPKGEKPAGGWRLPSASEVYPGNLTSLGELDNARPIIQDALAGYFQRQGTGSSKPEDYQFFPAFQTPKTKEEIALAEKYGKARVFFMPNGNVNDVDPKTEKVRKSFNPPNASEQMLVGIVYPAVKDLHPAITVFAYRNKGQIFMASLQWMVASIVLFALHLWWLGRFERKQKVREAQLASGARQPVAV